jgi:hypothetical protein
MMKEKKKGEAYPTKTPDVEEKGKVSEEQREKGGFGMAEKGGVEYPPKRKDVKKE